jgi:hypothetical protein
MFATTQAKQVDTNAPAKLNRSNHVSNLFTRTAGYRQAVGYTERLVPACVAPCDYRSTMGGRVKLTESA